MSDYSEHILGIRKLLATAEAECTLLMLDEARETFRQIAKHAGTAEACCWNMENEATALRYRRAGHAVTVTQVDGATAVHVKVTDLRPYIEMDQTLLAERE